MNVVRRGTVTEEQPGVSGRHHRPASDSGVSLARRLELLAAEPSLRAASPAARQALAEVPRAERVPAGQRLAGPELADDRLCLIVEGKAEATVPGPDGPIRLATLDAGVFFGEVDFLMPDSRREATVTAIEPLLLLVFDREALSGAIAAHPELRHAFATSGEDRLEAAFLAKGSHFASLDPGRLRRLTARLEPVAVAAGETVVREGEPGDRCYLVRGGSVELLCATEDGGERCLSTLGPGTLFGEDAVLTDGPYTMTARAVSACDLLVLHRDDLLAVLVGAPNVGSGLVELLHLRSRPRQVAGVQVYHREEPGGESVTVLKDPSRGAYYRLSPNGWFIWQRLDGRHSLRDLAMDYLTEYKAFAPGLIAGEVAELAAAGFVEGIKLRPGVADQIAPLSPVQRAMLGAKRLLEWRRDLPGTAGAISALYRRAVWPLFTPIGQIGVAGVALAGLVALALNWGRFHDAASGGGAWTAFFWVAAYVLAILVHELGHAFAVNAFGFRGPLGIGWYWFAPILYVNTSEMWLADRRQRIVVSAAGPYATLVFGSLAALGAWLAGGDLGAALWRFALLSYIWVLINFDPLLEYDGYYILVDVLDRPNLRADALAWLGRDFLPALRAKGIAGLRGHRLEVIYGIAAVLYIGVVATMTLFLYRIFLQDWLAHIVPDAVATATAWLLAGGVVTLAFASVAGELRKDGRQPSRKDPVAA